ncbi:uncharacterized protein LOC132143118 [Carassius carassius]|uniref:uncharacterized protein LOC132143118 n=1 Tax=Carassius carassius TaxID=217509 RepID=UPI0028689933|nr:uncharacterized protein LOC132143118 [Carassius carassius]
MNSLVGYGLSSESEEEEKGKDKANESFKKTECTVEKMKSRNFLLESDSPSSESESGPENEDQEEPPAANRSFPEPLLSIRPHTHKLPPPPLGGSSSGGALTGSSVFANPFKELAEERLNVLQKHVPLTLQARPTQIDGKRICVAHRKDGRCRFGSRCKFAHDSDLQSNHVVTSDSVPKDNVTVPHNDGPLASREEDAETDGEKDNEQRKKRRVGVNDSLIPPKRALKQYARLSQP